jgi:hypothetical protein
LASPAASTFRRRASAPAGLIASLLQHAGQDNGRLDRAQLVAPPPGRLGAGLVAALLAEQPEVEGRRGLAERG